MRNSVVRNDEESTKRSSKKQQDILVNMCKYRCIFALSQISSLFLLMPWLLLLVALVAADAVSPAMCRREAMGKLWGVLHLHAVLICILLY